MTETNIRELARQFHLDDADTGNVFALKRDVTVMQKADDIGAEIVTDLARKLADIEQFHSSEVAELVRDIVYSYVERA